MTQRERPRLTQVIASVTGQAAVLDAIPAITQDTYRLVADISKLKELVYEPKMRIERDGAAIRSKTSGGTTPSGQAAQDGLG